MKVSASKVDGFVRSLSPEFRAVLVYGPDNGLVRERVTALVSTIAENPADPFKVADLSPSVLARDAVRLVDEVLAIPFGGGRRVLVIREAGDEVTEAVSAVLENQAGRHELAALVIVGAGNLAPRSSLRRLFEGDDACAALPCYPDDEAGLAQLIRSSFSTADITFDQVRLLAVIPDAEKIICFGLNYRKRNPAGGDVTEMEHPLYFL